MDTGAQESFHSVSGLPRGLRASGMTLSAVETAAMTHGEAEVAPSVLPIKADPCKVINASWEVPREMLERGGKVAWLPGLLSFGCVSPLEWLGPPAWCLLAAALVRGAVVDPVVWSGCLARSSSILSSGTVFFVFFEKGRRPKDRSLDSIPSHLAYLRTLCYGRGIRWSYDCYRFLSFLLLVFFSHLQKY